MTEIQVGKVMLTPKGEYDSTKTYTRLDAVTYQGSSYVCLADTSTTPPGDSWQLLADKGADGQPGKDGQPGSPGVTPHIDETTGNWFIGTTNTGVKAQGPAGQNGSDGKPGSNGSDGVSPHIDSATGHWFIGSTDTGVSARGPQGPKGDTGTFDNTGLTSAPAFKSLQNQVDNSAVGTNLLLDSQTQKNVAWYSQNNSWIPEQGTYLGSNIKRTMLEWDNARYSYKDLLDRGVINTTDDFTYSIYFRVVGEDPAGMSYASIMFFSSATTKDNATFSQITSLKESQWTRLVISFKFNGSKYDPTNIYGQSIRFEISRAPKVAGAYYEFAAPKLEKGSVATDWSPAPEDAMTAIQKNATAIATLNSSAMQNRGTVCAPDFNSLTQTGFYTITDPIKGKNYPIGNWGTLEVSGQVTDGNGRLDQKYVSDNDGMTFTRLYNNSNKTWTAWVQVANQYDINTLNGKIATNSTQITDLQTEVKAQQSATQEAQSTAETAQSKAEQAITLANDAKPNIDSSSQQTSRKPSEYPEGFSYEVKTFDSLGIDKSKIASELVQGKVVWLTTKKYSDYARQMAEVIDSPTPATFFRNGTKDSWSNWVVSQLTAFS